MKFLTFALLLSFSLTAWSRTFKCEATHNSDLVFASSVELGTHERNKAFADLDEFVFFLSDNKNNVIELQTLNRYEPTRSYATAKVNASGDFVQLSIWKREYLLEVTCTLQ